MNEDHGSHVPIVGLLLAFLIPVGFAAVAALLLAQAGPHEVVLAGVPRGERYSIEVARSSEAAVTREDVVARAKEEARVPEDAPIRQVALGRYSEDADNESTRGRLVWLVNFSNADDISHGPGSCAIGAEICTCHWSYHASYVYTAIDAITGEFLFQAEGGRLDPLRPPRNEWPRPVTEDERRRCEDILEETAASH